MGAGQRVTTIHAETALLSEGWRDNVSVVIREGRVATVEAGALLRSGDARVGALLPGVTNLHSHAFQRAMAGLAERRGTAGADSFWSWRETMYALALALSPDEIEAVAAQAFAEMLEAGFSRVVEFHYLHHATSGDAYANPAEMAAAVAAAATEAGIGLTLLPVFYAHSGFGGAAPTPGQRRFVNDRDGFLRLLEGSSTALAPVPGSVLGVAAHSLRAVTPDELAFVAALRPDAPIHIHGAEQVREVEDCIHWSGARPVEWLLDNAAAGPRWCLVHATHMTEDETRRLAATGAVAGLCPITEANLGDGLFPAPEFLRGGGRLGVGSDSNVLISLAEELRTLEYGQRLTRCGRNVLAPPGGSTGRTLFEAALSGGAQAGGVESAAIAPGAPADLVALDLGHPALVGKRADALLDAFVFGAARSPIESVWVAGRQVVREGRHIASERIAARFAATMRDLGERIA